MFINLGIFLDLKGEQNNDEAMRILKCVAYTVAVSIPLSSLVVINTILADIHFMSLIHEILTYLFSENATLATLGLGFCYIAPGLMEWMSVAHLVILPVSMVVYADFFKRIR